MVWYFILLTIFAIRKAADQVRSRRNAAVLAGRGLLPHNDQAMRWLLVTHLAFFVLTPLEVLLLHRPFVPLIGIPMLGLFAAASVLRYWSTSVLDHYWTSRVAVPRDMQPVVCGPYRLIRHPNYLAMSLELVALDLVHTAWISALVVGVLNAWTMRLRIEAEEQVLFQIPAYRAAMEDKARLIPGVY